MAPFVQVLARWDGFDPDDGTGRRDFIVLGLNWWPTSATELQINHLVNPRDAAFDRHQLLVNFQFGF